mgnify:CR=1 FL=1
MDRKPQMSGNLPIHPQPCSRKLNFTEDSQMLWPVNGQVVIDYSMDATTYFPTLDQYKYNDA